MSSAAGFPSVRQIMASSSLIFCVAVSRTNGTDIAMSLLCDSCKFSHDLKAYLNENHADLRLAPISALVHYDSSASHNDAAGNDLLQDAPCPSFDHFGICLSGWKCRFLRHHIKAVGAHQPGDSYQDCGWVQLFDFDKMRLRAHECRSVTEGPEFASSMSVEEVSSPLQIFLPSLSSSYDFTYPCSAQGLLL